ncbi:MAG TPA: TatD family hydrolase [Candidatus Saccharimonadales bacterium]
MFVDTHCHIHESGFYLDNREEVYTRALDADVKMICIGTSEKFSFEAVEFAKTHENVWTTVGVHPHDAKDGWEKIGEILADNLPKQAKIVGIGEIGLDYFYDNSPRDTQIRALEQQLQWATRYNLPVSFHVRESFDDFWPIFANFPGLRGVLHSFTDSIKNMEKALSEGLFIGVNGISTFAKDKQEMWDEIPLAKILLETDAPFLTPEPFRGKMNEPVFVRNVAEYHANRRGVDLEELARITSTNATALFHLKVK